MTRHPSFGITLGVDWDSGTGYDTIGQVLDVSGPGVERDAIPIPYDHSNAANTWQKSFAGFPKPTEMSFALNLDPNSAMHVGGSGTGILGSFDTVYNGTSLPAFQYANPKMTGGTITITFDGMITKYNLNIGEVQGVQAAEVTIMPAGRWVVAVT